MIENIELSNPVVNDLRDYRRLTTCARLNLAGELAVCGFHGLPI